MGSRILLIDDEQHIADVVVYVLEEHGFACEVALDGDAGLARFEAGVPDLVLLDLKLPGRSGLELLRCMRERRPDVPVIMLTSLSDEADRILGLELGADDYVTKPFSARELAARVRAVLRRSGRRDPDAADILRHGPLVVDARALAVRFFDQPIEVTRPEFRLLRELVRHPARVFTRDALLDRIYEDRHIVTDRTIDTYVKRLRKKLAAVRPDVDAIQTVYGMGYKLRNGLEDLG
jgi:DNA-binding response OmpR family regulator